MRPDAWAIRHIALTPGGHGRARQWAALPFVDLLGVNAPSLDRLSGALDRPVFEDVVLMVGEESPWFINLQHVGHPDRARGAIGPSKILDTFSDLWAIHLLISPGGDPRAASVFFDNPSGRLAVAPDSYVPPEAASSEAARVLAEAAATALRYMVFLAQGSDHLVEIVPVAGLSSRERKTAQSKPWLLPLRRRVILLEPTRAKEHGHRADRGGVHASPHPHQRLGHWATLRAERYGNRRGERIWRRPSWVGDREWIFEGNRYKVITGAEPKQTTGAA